MENILLPLTLLVTITLAGTMVAMQRPEISQEDFFQQNEKQLVEDLSDPPKYLAQPEKPIDPKRLIKSLKGLFNLQETIKKGKDEQTKKFFTLEMSYKKKVFQAILKTMTQDEIKSLDHLVKREFQLIGYPFEIWESIIQMDKKTLRGSKKRKKLKNQKRF